MAGRARLRRPGAVGLAGVLLLAPMVVASAQDGHGYRFLSQPLFETVAEEPDVRVPMRDGVHLSAVVVRPGAPGKYPVVINYIPYGKQVDREWARRGYVAVFAEGRGTGRSEGVMADYFDAQSFRDGYDLVEWAAKQPWSTGKVGMWGISYGAINATRVAALRPPHLAAIAVNSSYANFYGDHWYPGGVKSNHPYVWHGVANVLFTMLRGPVYDDGHAGQALDIETWKRHIAENGWKGFFQPQWDHPEYDDYWREKDLRSKYPDFAVPTLQMANWFDHARNLDEAFQNYLVLKAKRVPQRLVVGPWTHGGFGPGPSVDFDTMRLAWFDHFLKGVKTGITEEPPVTLFVMRENRWRHEADWPIARTRDTRLYLGADGTLGDLPGGEGGRTFAYRPWVGSAAGPYGTWFDAAYHDYLALPDQRVDEAESLTFTGAPLTEAVEMTGMAEASFYATSTAANTDFTIKISDVQPDGRSELVTRGWINSSHRESNVNPRRPEDWSVVAPSPIVPGTAYRYRVTLQNIAYTFRPGHRIRVTIASSDWPSNWPNPEPADNTVLAGSPDGRDFSSVTLPIVPAPATPLPAPRLPMVARRPAAPRDTSERIWIEQDLIRNTMSYRLRSRGAGGGAPRALPGGGTMDEQTEWRIDLTRTAPYRQVIDYRTTYRISQPGKPGLTFVYRVVTDSAGPRATVDLTEEKIP